MNPAEYLRYHMERQVSILIDRMRGLDFLTVVQPEGVGLDSQKAFRSSPSGDKYLWRLLDDLNISSADAITDIGCGKGSAMRTMLDFPFARVDGVELSGEIAAIAQENFRKLKKNQVHVFSCDATTYNDYDRYNCVYFYNPFPDEIMRRVVDRLIKNIENNDRELFIIYNNPRCHDVIISQGVFERRAIYPDQWGHGIAVYSNRETPRVVEFINKARSRQGVLVTAADTRSAGKSPG